jgi:SAM-dependent methyltransferase
METCRACGSKLDIPFLCLGKQPLSNAYLTEEQVLQVEPSYPLDVYVCRNCFLVQIGELTDARLIFSKDYPYFSSYSSSWLTHCEDYTEMMIKRFGIDTSRQVVEIGSNDGYLLQYFKKRGIPVLGIEPASGPSAEAIKKGVPTETVYFTADYAAMLRSHGRTAGLIIGNNVLAHNPNIRDFVRGLGTLLEDDGLITLEFPHLLRMLNGNEFDTIYHEHYSYLSAYSLQRLLESEGLCIFDVEELSTHGGSLRVYVSHKKAAHYPISPRVDALLQKERNGGLLSLDKYYSFSSQVDKVKRDLVLFLVKQKASGKKVAGYGAPAKGNTLLNYCGIGVDLLEYTVDRSPHKQGKHLPGSHIPILDPRVLAERRPDYVLLLPWNLADEIMEQQAEYLQQGGHFVIPIPELVVI